jgi:hypothetical protein
MTYDKSIELQEDEYVPVIRIDDEKMYLPAQATIAAAQDLLAAFPPDYGEHPFLAFVGEVAVESVIDPLTIKLIEEDANEGNVLPW